MATGRDHGHPFTGQLVGGCQTNTRSATQDNGSLPLQYHRPLPLSQVPRRPAPVYTESRVPCTSMLCYCPALIKSAQRSAIIIVVTLVLARTTSGMMEASATRKPERPCTWHHWSTTAIG